MLDRFETITVTLLLPLFFAFTGLRTDIGSGQGPADVDVLRPDHRGGHGGQTWRLHVRRLLSGMPWREAAGLGTLMNTRGLMELVILNIGLDIGVISPALFSMMVIMALVTTFMTTPVLSLICQRR